MNSAQQMQHLLGKKHRSMLKWLASGCLIDISMIEQTAEASTGMSLRKLTHAICSDIYTFRNDGNFIEKILIILIVLLKTLIVGIHSNRLAEAVLMSTHNLCYRTKIRKTVNPCIPQVFYIKLGFK